MPYVVILKENRKVAVMPTMTRPCQSQNDPAWEFDFNNRWEQEQEWEKHLKSLPVFEIPDFQDREPGAELTGVREVYQMDDLFAPGWFSVTKDAYDSIEEGYNRRIILVPAQVEEEDKGYWPNVREINYEKIGIAFVEWRSKCGRGGWYDSQMSQFIDFLKYQIAEQTKSIRDVRQK